jgi:hypothetical protein
LLTAPPYPLANTEAALVCFHTAAEVGSAIGRGQQVSLWKGRSVVR